MAQAQFLRRNDDDRALAAIEAALISTGRDPAEVSELMNKLRRRPVIRWFVLKAVREEVIAAGLAGSGQIDWEAIGDFIAKIAPIIIEILMMFL